MRQPDAEFQDRLTYAGGTNQYGDPVFRFAWGETETFIASDGIQYREFSLGSMEPCWMLLMWEPAETYGHPALFYLENAEENGMCILGEFPYAGKYRLIHKFVARHVVGDRAIIDRLELDTMLIDAVLPLVKIWQGLSAEEKVHALSEDQRIRNHEASAEFEGKKSLYREREGSIKVRQKAAVLEKHWDSLMKLGSRIKMTGKV